MPCSLRSQLQRMFVPESAFDLVSEDDLVVTSDVDTFVMRPDIFEELLEPQNLDKISILQVILFIIFTGSAKGIITHILLHYLNFSMTTLSNMRPLLQWYSFQCNIGCGGSY